MSFNFSFINKAARKMSSTIKKITNHQSYTIYLWKANEEHVVVDLPCFATKLFICDPTPANEALCGKINFEL